VNNDNLDGNQSNIDVYADDPSEGQERNRVTQDTQTGGRDTVETILPSQQSGSERDRTLQQTANQRGLGPISSGQQSSTSSDSSSAGGFSQPESGFGQQGGYVQPQTGYNESSYNQPGTYSQSQGDLRPHMDGLRNTQGSSYDSAPGSPDLAEKSGDPNRSGTQPAINTPGTVVDTPGRDTGSAWGMDEQMGSSTDTADRRNLAE
jgi:hypothetical protein